MATVPAGTGGAYHTAAEGRPQGDGRLYVDGDAPWFAPMLFEPATGQPTPGQDSAANNPFHAPLKVEANATGNAWRFVNVRDWSPGMDSGGVGATPQVPYSPGQSDVASRYFAAKQALLAFGQALGLE